MLVKLSKRIILLLFMCTTLKCPQVFDFPEDMPHAFLSPTLITSLQNQIGEFKNSITGTPESYSKAIWNTIKILLSLVYSVADEGALPTCSDLQTNLVNNSLSFATNALKIKVEPTSVSRPGVPARWSDNPFGSQALPQKIIIDYKKVVSNLLAALKQGTLSDDSSDAKKEILLKGLEAINAQDFMDESSDPANKAAIKAAIAPEPPAAPLAASPGNPAAEGADAVDTSPESVINKIEALHISTASTRTTLLTANKAIKDKTAQSLTAINGNLGNREGALQAANEIMKQLNESNEAIREALVNTFDAAQNLIAAIGGTESLSESDKVESSTADDVQPFTTDV